MIDQQTLPTLQPAVDALFQRVTAGRGVPCHGTAIVTGLTGDIAGLSEDETAILADAMGSKYGDRSSKPGAATSCTRPVPVKTIGHSNRSSRTKRSDEA